MLKTLSNPFYVASYGHCMWDATMSLGQDYAIQGTRSCPRVVTKPFLSTNFTITSMNVSEMIGFLGKLGSNTKNWYKKS